MSSQKKSQGQSGKAQPKPFKDFLNPYEPVVPMKYLYYLSGAWDMPETNMAGDLKDEFERFMKSCKTLMERDPNWVVQPDVDDPLVRFSLKHTVTGTLVTLNYPFNEVIVEGRTAFLERYISEKVSWPVWQKFCEGKIKTM